MLNKFVINNNSTDVHVWFAVSFAVLQLLSDFLKIAFLPRPKRICFRLLLVCQKDYRCIIVKCLERVQFGAVNDQIDFRLYLDLWVSNHFQLLLHSMEASIALSCAFYSSLDFTCFSAMLRTIITDSWSVLIVTFVFIPRRSCVLLFHFLPSVVMTVNNNYYYLFV